MTECFDQAQIFLFVKATVARRKHGNFGSRMAEDQEPHVPAEPVAEPSVVFAIHS